MSALNAYSRLMFLPTPSTVKPGTSFDWFDAAPMKQTPEGLVQQSGEQRQKGLVPGTLFGGLVDTRYTQGLESQIPAPPTRPTGPGPQVVSPTPLGTGAAPPMMGQAAMNPLDVDLATGVSQYDREAQYQQLIDAYNKANYNISLWKNRKDLPYTMPATIASRDSIESYINQFLANGQKPLDPQMTRTALAVANRQTKSPEYKAELRRYKELVLAQKKRG